MPKRALLFLILSSLGLLCGCKQSVSRLDAADREHPLMRRALQREQSGDLDAAVRLYEQILLEAPRTASAHLALALLLHDYRQEYVGAIYHYQAYLQMRPETEKATMLRDRIRVAEQLLAAQLARGVPEEGVAGLDAHAVAQIRVLNQRISKLESERDKLGSEKESLARKVSDLERDNQRLRRRVEMLLEPPRVSDTRSRTANVRERVARGEAAEPVTYTVKPGDSLSRIADIYYGDSRLWPRIRDANRGKVDSANQVKPGQILMIPPKPNG